MVDISKHGKTVSGILIFFSAILLYFNTFNHKYALDDSIVITDNIYTKNGISGIKDIFKNDSFTGFFKEKKDLVPGGRYRPLSIATFALEYEFFGENPGISHIINVIFYALTGILIFIIFSKLTSSSSSKNYFLSLPLICSLLFIFHPVHTEVVSNIKGRDELLALIFSLAALLFTINNHNSIKIKYLLLAGISFFLALLSKENAIIFALIIPLTVYFFTKSSSKKIFVIEIPLLLSASLFLYIRYKVLGEMSSAPSGELMNNPFLFASVPQKYATIFYTLGVYFRLMFFPHPLTFDYYPYHIELVNLTNIWVIISLMVYVLLIVITISGFRKKTILSYGILLYLLPLILVSNLIFNLGTFMNERFAYFSSLGFCIIIAWFLAYILPGILNKSICRIIIPIFLLFFLILYSTKTISRNKAWENDFTLFTTDVKISSNSAKSNCSAGGILLEEAQIIGNKEKRNSYLEQSLKYLNKAIIIHPEYVDALRLLGNAHFILNKDIEKSIYYYKKVLLRSPLDETTYKNINLVLNDYNNVDHKITIYKEILQINSNRFDISYKLGNLYGKYKSDIPKALIYLKMAASINPDNKNVCKDLGVAYGISGQFSESIKWLKKAIMLEPDDHTLYTNLGITYQRMGNLSKANEYFLMARKMKK